MSISVIRAAFECDGCGKPFKVDIEPSTKNWMRRQDMLSIAENAIRGGMTSDGEFCSIQADMHLCGDCTAVADAIRPDEDEYQPTADEIKRKLGAISRSEEHTSDIQSLMRISYAVFCMKKKNKTTTH